MESQEARRKIKSLGTEFSADSFFLSLKNGDCEMVQLFLDGGMPADTRDREGNAAVLVASRTGQMELARLLLARGASPEALLVKESKGKDTWDKITATSGILSFISSVLIAAVGGYFTYSYNQRQIELNRTQAEHDSATKEQGNKVLELEAIQKLIPTLTSKDEKQKAAALTAIQDLAHPALAADLAALFQGQGSIQYLQQAVSSGDSGTKQAAVKALSSIAASGPGPDSQHASRTLAIERARDSVLRIRYQSQNVEYVGSGICISADGEVLTAAHLLGRDGPASVTLSVGDLSSLATRLLASNQDLDLAILKVEGHGCAPAHFALEPVKIGSEVTALGFPAALNTVVAYAGVVAAVDPKVVYFDANVGPGLSGGPLLDNIGQVVGIVTGRQAAAAIALRSDIVVMYLQGLHIPVLR